MFFKKKLDRITKTQKSEESKNDPDNEMQLEKNDIPAMIIAAFLVLFPVVLVAAAILFGLAWLLAG